MAISVFFTLFAQYGEIPSKIWHTTLIKMCCTCSMCLICGEFILELILSPHSSWTQFPVTFTSPTPEIHPRGPWCSPVLFRRCWFRTSPTFRLFSSPAFLPPPLPTSQGHFSFFRGWAVASDGIRKRVQLGELSHWKLMSVFALKWLSLVRKRRLWRTRWESSTLHLAFLEIAHLFSA